MRNTSTCETCPRHIWKHEVIVTALAKGATAEACEPFMGKLDLWYTSGEPVWMAVDGVVFVARANNPRPVFGEAEQRAFMAAAGLPTPNAHGVPTVMAPAATASPARKVVKCSRCEGAGVVETRDCWSGGVTLTDEEECTSCDGLGRVLGCRADELPDLLTVAQRLRTVVADSRREPDISVDELALMPYGVQVARRAWLSKGHVLNTLPAGEFLRALAR